MCTFKKKISHNISCCTGMEANNKLVMWGVRESAQLQRGNPFWLCSVGYLVMETRFQYLEWSNLFVCDKVQWLNLTMISGHMFIVIELPTSTPPPWCMHLSQTYSTVHTRHRTRCICSQLSFTRFQISVLSSQSNERHARNVALIQAKLTSTVLLVNWLSLRWGSPIVLFWGREVDT